MNTRRVATKKLVNEAMKFIKADLINIHQESKLLQKEGRKMELSTKKHFLNYKLS